MRAHRRPGLVLAAVVLASLATVALASLATVALASLATATAPVTAPAPVVSAAAPQGHLEDRPCWADFGPQPPRCAVLDVPERWDAPDGHRVLVPVLVVDGGGNARDAILIPGGGGPGSSVGLESDSLVALVDELTGLALDAGRDVVVIDQRGAGLASPVLDCPEGLPALKRSLAEDLSTEAEAELFASVSARCAERLRAKGLRLEAFGSSSAAADLEALRRALGYEQWDLWGTSYGARLALTFVREFPGSTRSVILDSPDAPGADVADQPANFQRVLEDLFAGCAAAPRCHRDAPDPAGALDRLLARLAAHPWDVQLSSPLDLRPLPVRVTPRVLLEALLSAMYDPDVAHELPLVLTAADRGSDDLLLQTLREYVWTLLDARFADGLYDVVACRELIAGSDLDRLEREAEAHPWRQAFVGGAEVTRRSCAAWGVGSAPAQQQQAVAWPGPALILTGRLDPVIPPQDVARVSQALPGSRRIEFPAAGHSVEADLYSCIDPLIAKFVQSPTQPLDDAEVADCQASAAARTFWTLAPAEHLPPPPPETAPEAGVSARSD